MTDRGTSLALGYVLTLGIVTILISGLIIVGGSFVSDQQENVVRQELTVVGNQLAGNVEQADRLVNASEGSDTRVRLSESFPQQVSGTQYTVELVSEASGDGETPTLELTSDDADVTVEVELLVSTPVETSSSTGGTTTVYYDSEAGPDGDGALVIRDE